MHSSSVLKRQRKNIKIKKYNKLHLNFLKKNIKNLKKNINKFNDKKLNKSKSLLFSILDKINHKNILSLNKISRIKRSLSILINKHLAH